MARGRRLLAAKNMETEKKNEKKLLEIHFQAFLSTLPVRQAAGYPALDFIIHGRFNSPHIELNQAQLGEERVVENLYEGIPIYQIQLLLFSEPDVQRDRRQLGRTDTGEEGDEPDMWGDFGRRW
jgi:hypothetical protein